MSKVLLMRHGQTMWNLEKRFQGNDDSPLTEEGKRQAVLVSKRLQGDNIKAIFCSPRNRAVLTATPTAKKLSLPIYEHHGLTEISLGKWEGKKYDEIKNLYPGEYEAFFNDPASFAGVDGGESLIQVRDRAVEALEEIAHNHNGNTVLVVSHAITIRLLLTFYMKKPLKELWKVGDITQTSLSQIVFSDTLRQVIMTGNIDHLEPRPDK